VPAPITVALRVRRGEHPSSRISIRCNHSPVFGACYNEMIQSAAVSATVEFEEFFADRYRSASRFAFLLTGSSAVAEELAQDAFLQMFRRWADIRDPRAYLTRALVSGARSWGRKERRRTVDPPDRSVEHDSDAIAVRDALWGLPARQREALVLRYFLGCLDREIAEAMGCPVGTVKSLLHRGLANLKETLR
jgi:RNA polymerase sigma-70 factor (sigma-E family)